MSALVCLALAARSATVADAAVIDALVAGCGELPSLEAVQNAAVETLAISDEETARGWAARARWRGLAPQVDVAVGSDADVDVRDSWEGALQRTTSSGRKLGIEVGARWALGELIFSDAELRANREMLARSATVQLARERATKLFFERIEVYLLSRERPSRELSLALARLDGLLRAITGGRLLIPQKGTNP
jgi:hypothetical protein